MIRRMQELQAALPGQTLGLTVVNDGSTSGVSAESETLLRTQIPALQWIAYVTNRGKGFALREGLRRSSAEHVIYTDIDFPYQNQSMVDVVHALLHHQSDLAVGVRDAAYYTQIPPSRRRISRLLRQVNKILFGLKISDTQCGLKGMNRTGRDLFLNTTIDRYLFDLELIMLASRRKEVTVRPVVVHLAPGVSLSSVPASLLIKELGNLLRLFVKRWL